MDIALLNVKYSPNLGDGIIAECFEAALKASPDVNSVRSCDLAGRTTYGDGVDASRQLLFSILECLPPRLRALVFATLLRRLISTKLRAHYADGLAGADVVIVGGGQLIADSNLNFPLKLSSALEQVDRTSTSVAIHGVGIGLKLGRKGRLLLRRAFGSNLVATHVRDQRSVERWNKQFSQPAAQKVWDPGLLASEVYGWPKRTERPRPLVGFGITHPATLMRHADSKETILTIDDWTLFYQDLVRLLAAQNCDVELFSNGASEDDKFAASVYSAISSSPLANITVTLAERPKVPRQVAHTIAGYDAIIAHRLHANAIAYSYGIPHVGMGWDSKMEGFFEETKRSKYLIQTTQSTTPANVGVKLMSALREHIEPVAIASIQSQIHEQISDLVEKILVSRTQSAQPSQIPIDATLVANDVVEESRAIGH